MDDIIVFDTETTGFDPSTGDRMVEIGAINIGTKETFHEYINPERDMPASAFKVHGLSTEFLSTKPLFRDIVDRLVEFIDGKKLVAHNASFDMRFVNFELKKAGRAIIPDHLVVDTLAIARKKFPGAQASLDALCKRFKIDNSNRIKHGALLDAELLVEVYLELTGGRQQSMLLEPEQEAATTAVQPTAAKATQYKERCYVPSKEEIQQHLAFLAGINDNSWLEEAASE